MSRVGFLWCQVCKAWRPVSTRGAYAYHCHRCDWDTRATVLTMSEIFNAWLELDDE